MITGRTRRLGAFAVRYGVAYPGVVAAGLYVAAAVLALPFDTVLFAAFATVAVLTAIGAMSGPSSGDPVHSGGGLPGTSDPGESWGTAAILKLLLFDLALAVILTVYTLWRY